jgi:hypothetical protein
MEGELELQEAGGVGMGRRERSRDGQEAGGVVKGKREGGKK